MAETPRIRCGVVGYGGIYKMGQKHLADAKAAGFEPAAVAEMDAARLNEAKEEWPGLQYFSSAQEMFNSGAVDMVIIITPHNTHYPLAKMALEANLHVVLEKPFAITTEECDELIELAAQKQKLLTVYHNRHWDGWVLAALRDIKQRKLIGELMRVELRWCNYGKPEPTWRGSKKVSGGILYDWGVHLIEYALQIIDDDIVEVSGFSHEGYWKDQTDFGDDCIEDDAQAIVRFAGGVALDVKVSQLEANAKEGKIEIIGTEGSYVLDWSWDGDENYPCINKFKDGQKICEKAEVFPQSEHHLYYTNLANHLYKGDPLVITPEWARRPLHIIDLAVQSAKENRTLPAKHK